jgi:DNA-binding transcriptional LysR family regulator
MFDNYKSLRAFRAVMETGTLTKAAERLGVTQPAVSRLIFSLEEETGLVLFRRERQRLQATDEAQIFYQEVVRILADWEQIPHVANEIKEKSGARLRVATIPKLGTGFLPPILSAYAREYPTTRVTVHVGPTKEIEKLIESDQFDFGLVRIPENTNGIKFIKLFDLPSVVVVGPDHRLAGRQRVSIAELAEEKFITQPRGLYMRGLLEKLLSDIEIVPNVQIESASTVFACHMASRGAGVSLCDPVTARWAADPSCTVMALEEGADCAIGLIHAADSKLSAEAETLVDVIKKTVPDILAGKPLPSDVSVLDSESPEVEQNVVSLTRLHARHEN